jgi:hypothetical protein
MSSSSSVNEALTGYLAGRLTADRIVAAVTAEYYRDTGNGKRETLRPIMDVIERAHPGVVELTGSDGRPGFAIKLAERPFPKRYESELRQAVHVVLGNDGVSAPRSVLPAPGLFTRLLRAIRRVFTA